MKHSTYNYEVIPMTLKLAFEGEGINIERLIERLEFEVSTYHMHITREQVEEWENTYREWLIEILREFQLENPEIIKNILIFWTNSGHLNTEKTYKVDIRYRDVGDGYIPQSHTCFYTIDIHAYSSRDIFKEKLRVAAEYGTQGFGFA